MYRETSPPRPYKECSSNPFTVFVLTEHGGHCAHLPLGSWVTGKAWMDTVAMQFFSAVLTRNGKHGASVSAIAAGVQEMCVEATVNSNQASVSGG